MLPPHLPPADTDTATAPLRQPSPPKDHRHYASSTTYTQTLQSLQSLLNTPGNIASKAAPRCAEVQPGERRDATPSDSPDTDFFTLKGNCVPSPVNGHEQSPNTLPPAHASDGILFAAFRSLPVPVTVLSSAKTIVFTNKAMNRLLASVDNITPPPTPHTLQQQSYAGMTLSELGINVIKYGQPIWVSWSAILDHLIARETAPEAGPDAVRSPGIDKDHPMACFARKIIWEVEDPSEITLEVVLSAPVAGRRDDDTGHGPSDDRPSPQIVFDQGGHVFAKMIISTWITEEGQCSRRFFTLTFTKTDVVTDTHVPDQIPDITTTAVTVAPLAVGVEMGIPGMTLEDVMSPTSSIVEMQAQLSKPTVISSGTKIRNLALPDGPPKFDVGEQTLLQKLTKIKDALIDNTTMPIVGIWRDGTVAYPNKAARALFGKHIPENRTFYFADLVAKWTVWNEDFTRQLPVDEFPMKILLDTLEPFEGKRIGIIKENGRRVVFDVLGEIIYDTGLGECLGGVVSYRDVTDMAADITHYRRSDNEKFRNICDAMPQLVWTAKPNGYLDFFNQQWYEYTGLSRDDCAGFYVEGVVHPEDDAATRAAWQQAIKTGEPFELEYRCRDRHGDYRWFLARAKPTRLSEGGPITSWFGTSTDVHEAVVSKRLTEWTREQLRSVMAHAKVTLFTVDREHKITMLEGGLVGNGIADIVDANGIRWYIGHDVSEVFNMLTGVLPVTTCPSFLQSLDNVMRGIDSERVMEHDINNRWYRTRFVPMLTEENRNRGGYTKGVRTAQSAIEGVIGVIMDVTEHHSAIEEETRRRHEAMANEKAAKEATLLKSQFLANMSHEFRTPIQWVLGYTDILNTTMMTKEQEQTVATIRNSATILLTLINDILDFSKIESGKMALDEIDFQLSTVLTETTEMRLFEAKKKEIDFNYHYASGIPELNLVGDCNRLRQILNNILDNSFKFTREGFVYFKVEVAHETPETISLRFSVQDTGIGIDTKKQEHIFEPFLQGDASTAREFGGTGLGLSICKSFLDLMHGDIKIESQVGRGTTVRIEIPFPKSEVVGGVDAVTEQAALMALVEQAGGVDKETAVDEGENDEEGEEEETGAPAAHRRKESSLRRGSSSSGSRTFLPPREQIKILIVEDNPLNAKLMIKLLQKINFTRSYHVWNGKEAIEFLEETQAGRRQKPSLILMDCQMPIMDGYECTKILRTEPQFSEYLKSVPIIAVTASAVAGDRERCLHSGMNEYLLKPITGSHLERTIIDWLIALGSSGAPARKPELPVSPSVPEGRVVVVMGGGEGEGEGEGSSSDGFK